MRADRRTEFQLIHYSWVQIRDYEFVPGSDRINGWGFEEAEILMVPYLDGR